MNMNDFKLNSRGNWEGGRELRNNREKKLQKLFSACKRDVLVEVTELIYKIEY